MRAQQCWKYGLHLLLGLMWVEAGKNVLQARPGEAPAWLPSSCHSWLEMWTRLPSPEHVRAVCTELLSQAPHLLAELHEGECTEPQSTRNANARSALVTRLASVVVQIFLPGTMKSADQLMRRSLNLSV